METRVQFLAFNANGHDVMGLDCPSMVRASEERKKLKEAIEVLNRMKHDAGAY